MVKREPLLYRVLVLEDDLEAASKIMAALFRIEPHLAPYDLDVTMLSTYRAVEDLVNGHRDQPFDIIVMDRDCKLNGSFHTLDVEHFGPEKVISISSKPEWNQLAQARGIEHIVPKSFSDLDGFAEDVGDLVLGLLQAKALRR